MRLFHNYSKLAYYRQFNKKSRAHLIWGLSLKPGDIINDCSGFNVVVAKIKPKIAYRSSGGWYIWDVVITYPNGGTCSLMSCGVEPPKSSEEISKNLISFWNDCPEWAEGESFDRYKAGLPICDENGFRI